MPLSQMEWIVLDLVRSRGCDLRKISEPFRQAVITLGVAEPPLLDVTADHARGLPRPGAQRSKPTQIIKEELTCAKFAQGDSRRASWKSRRRAR